MNEQDPKEEALTDEEIAEAQGGAIGEGDEEVVHDCFAEDGGNAGNAGDGRFVQQED